MGRTGHYGRADDTGRATAETRVFRMAMKERITGVSRWLEGFAKRQTLSANAGRLAGTHRRTGRVKREFQI